MTCMPVEWGHGATCQITKTINTTIVVRIGFYRSGDMILSLGPLSGVDLMNLGEAGGS